MFNGNFVLIFKEVFLGVGNLDPIFSHAQGYFDYGLIAKKLGVQSYISSNIVGRCERHDHFPELCNLSVKLKERLKAFKSPLGGCPKSTFIFERRHYGLLLASFHFLTIHLRLLFPSYWGIQKKVEK